MGRPEVGCGNPTWERKAAFATERGIDPLYLVGGYTSDMRETDDDALLRARLFADTRRFTAETCGDYSQPIAAGTIDPVRIEGDLFELASGTCRPRGAPDEITVFKNGGGGHLDLMVARIFHDLATAGDDQLQHRA